MGLGILRLLILLLLGSGVALAAWIPGWSSISAQNPSDSPKQQQDQSKHNKSTEKSSQKDLNLKVFSTAVANDVLNELRDGLEAHNQRQVLSAFDAEKMDGYLEFEDQIQAFFTQYESFRVYFRIVQSASEGPKGVVLVDIQLEETPRGGVSPPVRKNRQMRFELERSPKGWKIVDFNPRNFFS